MPVNIPGSFHMLEGVGEETLSARNAGARMFTVRISCVDMAVGMIEHRSLSRDGKNRTTADGDWTTLLPVQQPGRDL